MFQIKEDIIYSNLFDSLPVLKECYNFYKKVSFSNLIDNKISMLKEHRYNFGAEKLLVYPIGIYNDSLKCKLVYGQLNENILEIKEMEYNWAFNNLVKNNDKKLDITNIEGFYINTFVFTKAIKFFKDLRQL